MSDDQSSGRASTVRPIDRLTAYGPISVTGAVLLLQTFFPGVLEGLPIEVTSAIIAGSVVFLAWHLENNLIESTRELRNLLNRVSILEDTQSQFIESTNNISQTRLGTAFATIAAKSPRVGHLRIFAISSQQVLSFMKFHDISADKCDILLRGFGEDDALHADFRNQIRLVVADWRRMERSGRIKTLDIRYYDFHPTEYECIFDREHLILGLYDSDPDDYSEVSVRDPVLIRGGSDAGRLMVAEFAERFDNLFEVCAYHHGIRSLDPLGGEP